MNTLRGSDAFARPLTTARVTGAETEVRPLVEDTIGVVPEYWLKRPIDFCLATVGLLVALPFWIVIACAIKLEDGGPVLYIQSRWGRGKRPFRAYKFRSMVVDADERFGAVQAQQDDSRLTRVGRILRPLSFDEMPQLLNIWLGHMSWVGPRALPMNEKQVRESSDLGDDAIPGFTRRCAVRPGLTGIAQVFAPRDVPRRQKFRYDVLYIRLMSLSLDLRLICLSLIVTLGARWERPGEKFPRWLRRGVHFRRRARMP